VRVYVCVYMYCHSVAYGISIELYFVQSFEEEEEDGHDHGSEGHNHSKTTIWRGCCVLAGIFAFYMFEVVMSSVKKRMVNTSAMYLCMRVCLCVW